MKNFVIFAIVLCCMACKTTNKKSKNLLSSGYPDVIDSMKIQSLFDKTKWVLYCLYCNDTLIINKNISNKDSPKDTTTLGMLPLHFWNIITHGDSVELYFEFYYKNNSIFKYNYTAGKEGIIPGILYNKNSDSVLAYAGHGSYMVVSCDTAHHPECLSECLKNKYMHPLQPEVISYIKKNKEKIDPWFRSEAIKRGVLDTTATK